MSLENHPYRDFLHKVAKPARYTGGETNAVVKDPASVRVRMALAFPDVYDIGMSHLGTKILYSLINKRPDLSAERVFCPWVDMEAELRTRELPLLSLETASPLRDFDVVGFSLQYELTYTNILTMLDLSGIPFRWADRDESHPIVMAGGPCATQPEPMAPFIDVFLIGDAEEMLPEALEKIAELKERGASRRETLVELAKLGGLYCPALYETRLDDRTGFLLVGEPTEADVPAKTQRVILEDLNRYPFPDDSPVAAAEAIFDRMSVEIARGCTEGCRFCQAGMIYRPVRERDPEDIVNTLVSAIHKGGYDEASMTTLSTADYSCISPLIKRVMEKLKPEKVSLSVASLRAYGLDEETLDEIKSVRANGLTFAPEAGTQRMRDVINKNIADEDLERTGHRVFSRGWRRMKLYFMIGLPTETDVDVAGIMETGNWMRQIGRKYHGGKAGVTVSVSSHVPKPHTPFQWVAMDSLEEIERKQDLLKDLSRRYKLEFRRHDPRTSLLECILGRGDRRMGDLIEDAWKRGARFDSWDEHLRWDDWVAVLRNHDDIPYDAFTGTIPVDADLPWDHLDIQVEKKFLLRDYKRSLKDKLSPPCGKPVGAQVHHTNLAEHAEDQRILVCYHCGVACDMTQMRDERGEFLEKLGAYTRSGAEIPEGVEVATEQPEMTRPVASGVPVRESAASDSDTVVEGPSPGSAPTNSDAAATATTAGEATPPAETPSPGAAPKKRHRGTPAHDFNQGEPVRYRLRFAKSGVTALTGHLDFVRTLPRVVRRAGFSAYYTEGFHPKPVMEFSPPSSLGMTSLDEYVDLALTEEVSPAALLTRLREAAPEGLDFLAAHRILPGERKLSRAIAAAEYVVRVERGHLASLDLDTATVESAPAGFLSRDEVMWDVTRKRVPKRVNLREPVVEAGWMDPEALPGGVARREGARYLLVRVRLDGEGHSRPDEVAAAMLGSDPGFEPIHVTRIRLLRKDGDGFGPLIASVPDAETSEHLRPLAESGV